ncbi:MAG TPA: SgcJ/EcaC family oxidoreductase [Pyrinomonadaceae bacterium]
MSQRSSFFALAILALMVISPHLGVAQTPQSSSADETAIRQIVQQLQDGWNAHDGKAFSAPFATDADYVIVNGMKIKGREDIEKGHTGIFTTIYKDSHNVATVKGVRFLRPDVAVAHVEWNLEFTMGGEKRKAQAMNTLVLTKDGGKWSIAAFHNTPVQAQGPR